MPNFEVRITAGATRAIWTDEPTETKPSRLNHDPIHPHTFRQCTVGETVTMSAIVDGVAGPLDASLGGDTFTWWVAECPQWPAPSLTSPGGQSSVVSFVPAHAGHYLLVFHRSDGGRFLVPVEAVGT